MERVNYVLVSFLLALSFSAAAAPKKGRNFDRAIFVLFENTNYSSAIRQPFFKKLADDGAHFSNFFALAHPSQPNYIALTSGSTNGVTGNGSVDLDVGNIADLLEARGISWKVYAEDYPGNCYKGSSKSGYARKHNPFISYLNIQNSPSRCANIVNAAAFDSDAASGRLPEYVFYVPNNRNSGHDTGVAYADRWYGQKFSQYIADARFMENTVIISTFDEDGGSSRNQIYTSIVGPMVRPGVFSTQVTLYSLLRLIEENWNLGNLGKEDARAVPITGIWQ